jgi:hypothetical protein
MRVNSSAAITAMGGTTPPVRLSHATAAPKHPGTHTEEQDSFDDLLPCQLRDRDMASAWTPVQRLMAAVLEDGVACARQRAVSEGFRAPRLAAILLNCRTAEARDWVASDARHWPFAFRNVCDALGVDPEAVRAKLRRAA